MENPDASLSVQFFTHARENAKKSKEMGRPIYEEVEMVSISSAGNRKTEHTARAHSMHYDGSIQAQRTYAERFPQHYAAFKAGAESHEQGTPIAEAPFLNIAQKAEMRGKKITTVEQLAAMSDRDIRSAGMGFRAHVDAAKAYLDTSNGTAALSQEMAVLRRELEELRAAKAAPVAPPEESQFAAMAEEDLRNMLADAGVAVDGRWGKAKLVKEADALAAKATEAA